MKFPENVDGKEKIVLKVIFAFGTLLYAMVYYILPFALLVVPPVCGIVWLIKRALNKGKLAVILMFFLDK